MKKILLIFIAIVSGILSMTATGPEVVYFHSENFNGINDAAFRHVEKDSVGITVTYDFDYATFEPDDVYEGTYWCQLKGFGHICDESAPALCRRIDIFDIPANSLRPNLMLISYEYTDVDYPLTPARQDLIDNSDVFYSKMNVMPIQSSVFGGAEAIVHDFNFTCGYKQTLFEVQVMPVQYDKATGKTRIYNKIEYRINYIFPPDVSPSFDSQDKCLSSEQVDSYVEMGEDIEYYSAEGLPIEMPNASLASYLKQRPKNYLIISCNKYNVAVERFAELKRKYGMNTHISLRNSWSEGNITDSINHYLNIDPDIEYVLFFGSHNDIPAQYNDTLSTTTSVLTDYNYATYKDVTNNTTYQRFYLGRIPVRSLDEANHVVDKIIDYSLTPPEDEDYYNRGTNIAYFEGANDGVTEYRGYVHCSEEIKEYLDSLGYSIQRVYSANVAMPLYFDNHILMPDELRYYNYNWSKSQYDVANAINNGGFYVFHRDHGNETGWANPRLKNEDLGLLTNTDRLPIVFSINCSTGQFDYNECFAEKLLKMNNLGACGVIAATNTTATFSNNILAKGIFDCIFGSEGIKLFNSDEPKPLNSNISVENTELGRMLEVGLSRTKETYSNTFDYHTAVYHVFGDPSMMMWTKPPSHITDVVCEPIYKLDPYIPEYTDIPLSTKVFDGYRISMGQEGYVVILDTQANTTKLYKGNSGILNNLKFGRHKVFAYRPNYILTDISSNVVIQNAPRVDLNVKCFKLYPNPASSRCYVECSIPSIYNTGNIFVANISTGNVVKRFLQVGNNSTVEIDVSDLPNGEYIVKMLVGQAPSPSINGGTEKLIVNH